MKKVNGEIMIENDNEIHNNAVPPAKKIKSKTTVEEIYQKKSQLEHILLRPDTYIGNL